MSKGVTLKWTMPPSKLLARTKRNVQRAMMATGEEVRTRVVESILEGAILGPGHLPSAPGEAPNADIGDLHQSYGTAGAWTDGLTYEQTVGSPLAKAAALEDGTPTMAPRPHLLPAWEAERPAHLDRLARAVKAAAEDRS